MAWFMGWSCWSIRLLILLFMLAVEVVFSFRAHHHHLCLIKWSSMFLCWWVLGVKLTLVLLSKKVS